MTPANRAAPDLHQHSALRQGTQPGEGKRSPIRAGSQRVADPRAFAPFQPSLRGLDDLQLFPDVCPFTGYLLPGRPPCSHAGQARGKKERLLSPVCYGNSPLSEALQMLSCQLPPTSPRLQQPHRPPTAHVSPQLPFLPSTGDGKLLWQGCQSEAGLLNSFFSPRSHREHPPLQIIPFCSRFSPSSCFSGFVSLPPRQQLRQSPRCRTPTNTLKTPKNTRKVLKIHLPPRKANF